MINSHDIQIHTIFTEDSFPDYEWQQREWKTTAKPTEAKIAAIHDRIAEFDHLNTIVYDQILIHLVIWERYYPGWINSHSADYAIWFTASALIPGIAWEKRERSELDRWIAFFESGAR